MVLGIARLWSCNTLHKYIRIKKGILLMFLNTCTSALYRISAPKFGESSDRITIHTSLPV